MSKGKNKYTEESALKKLRSKRDVTTFEELKQVMVLRSSNNSEGHVGNGTLGVLDYLKNQCNYSVRYLNNNFYGKETIKEFKKSIKLFRSKLVTLNTFEKWLIELWVAKTVKPLKANRSKGRR